MSTTGLTASVTNQHEMPNNDKKTSQQKLPISPLMFGFSKEIAQDKKLAELSEKLQNIDESTISDFAKNLNGIGRGEIINKEMVNNAIKGLQYKGDTIPNVSNNNNFNQIDNEIKNITQKMMLLNSGLLFVNPNLILKNAEDKMVGLPVPVLDIHHKEFEELFKNDSKFSFKSKALLPKTAQDVFERNYPILKQKTVEEACNQNVDVANATEEDTKKISSEIVDSIAQIYQMVTLRFLAQLGSPVIPNTQKSVILGQLAPAAAPAA